MLCLSWPKYTSKFHDRIFGTTANLNLGTTENLLFLIQMRVAKEMETSFRSWNTLSTGIPSQKICTIPVLPWSKRSAISYDLDQGHTQVWTSIGDTWFLSCYFSLVQINGLIFDLVDSDSYKGLEFMTIHIKSTA